MLAEHCKVQKAKHRWRSVWVWNPGRPRPKFRPIRAQCGYPHQTSSKQNGDFSQSTLSFLNRIVLWKFKLRNFVECVSGIRASQVPIGQFWPVRSRVSAKERPYRWSKQTHFRKQKRLNFLQEGLCRFLCENSAMLWVWNERFWWRYWNQICAITRMIKCGNFLRSCHYWG